MDHNTLAAVAVTSFLGSWHCGAMCGPLSGYISTLKNPSLFFVGRFISYTVLGALSGYLGYIVKPHHNLQVFTSALLIIYFIIVGLHYLDINITNRFKFITFSFLNFNKIISKFNINKNSPSASTVIGLLLGLLPCGWLYSFVAVASTTQSPAGGALVMMTFSLMTMPILFFFTKTIQIPWFRVHSYQLKKLAGLILVSFAIYSILTININSHQTKNTNQYICQ